ncbi:MAG: hypothetical protein AAB587_02015 [Patescibacteria group bacterium]
MNISSPSSPAPLNIKKALFYAFTSVAGTAFYFFGLFTLLNILQRFLRFPIAPENMFSIVILELLFLCYVVLNFFIGYGLVNRRRWTLSVSLISTALLLGLSLVRYFGIFVSQYASFSVFLPPAVFALMAGVLFLNRGFLNEKYVNVRVIVPFVTLLLITIFFTNTISIALYAY